ncbi:hypothetical protein [Acrocarpospora catenulata]|uniref:hypothetical protein n=1 Tax=Acrocarpospora catenulata TaxID=2836182 RepID=UPI001BD9A024|nr:hypothetical protein [Acrocarpospora catenulata]
MPNQSSRSAAVWTSPPPQEAMLQAAATAVQLAANGTIIPGGTLGPALQPAPHWR